MDATIPVNTFVGMGTKSIFHTGPIYRTFHSGCVQMQTQKPLLSISSGAPIRVFLRKKPAYYEEGFGSGSLLLNGDAVEILSICGNAPLSDARILALDPASSEKDVIWKSVADLPAPADLGAAWRVVDTAVPFGQPLEMFQGVRLLSAQHPDQAVSVYAYADTRFRLAPLSETASRASRAGQLASSTPVPNAVEFYVTSPHYLAPAHTPTWVTRWFPRHAEGREAWLTSWNQHSALHTRQRQKWESITVSRIPIPAGAPHLLESTPSVASPTGAWVAEEPLNIVRMWKTSRSTAPARSLEPVRKWK